MSFICKKIFISGVDIEKSSTMKVCFDVLMDLFVGVPGLPRLSFSFLDPIEYPNLAYYASDCISLNTNAKYEMFEFACDLAEKRIPIEGFAALDNGYYYYAIPAYRIEYAVALAFTYCYLVKAGKGLDREFDLLLLKARECTADGASAVVDYLVKHILGKRELVPDDKDRRIAELEAKVQQLTDELEKMQAQAVPHAPKDGKHQASAVVSTTPRGPFGETAEGQLLDVGGFAASVQQEFAHVKSAGEWAALYFFCRQQRLVPNTMRPKAFFDSLFGAAILHDADGHAMAAPPEDPTYRYCNVLLTHGKEVTWQKVKDKHRITGRCIQNIKLHINHLEELFKNKTDVASE